MIQFLSEEAVSDPLETRGNQDVRYQEFNEVTPEKSSCKVLDSGVTSFLSVCARWGAFLLPVPAEALTKTFLRC